MSEMCRECGKAPKMYSSAYCKQCRADYRAKFKGVASTPTDNREMLARLCKTPVSIEELANKLDVSPAKARGIVDRARKDGVHVMISGDKIAVTAAPSRTERQDTGIKPIASRTTVGVVSDLHFGSRYQLGEQLDDCVRSFYAAGVRDMLVPGDLLDGNYVGHGLFELSHVGLDNQADALLDGLPRLQGLRYHAIMGNHDLTFTTQNGVDTGEYLVNRFARRGRSDLLNYGNRGAYLRLGKTVVHLWHPGGGGSYARSYKLQKRVEAYSPGEKPHIVLAGHWHQFCYVEERGVHAVACPTFQGGGSAFGKSLTGSPSIGGLLLTWGTTSDGTLRDFAVMKRSYFEREEARSITNG